jgi:hypothetical protein
MTTKRIAVVSTPRSGNTWLRGLLRGLTDGVELAQHRPRDVAWDALPGAAMLQLHWYPTSQFRALLRRHDFAVVTVVRHPLDVLMSILHFCRHDTSTVQWLDGVGGSEHSLINSGPLSPELADYACSQRFELLMGVSASWTSSADAWIRYEDLVQDTAGQLQRLASSLDLPHVPDQLDAVIATKTMATVRQEVDNHHYWQGRPGLWRSLLPPGQVELLRPALADFTEPYGYELTPDPDTTPATAQAAWDAMAVPPRS